MAIVHQQVIGGSFLRASDDAKFVLGEALENMAQAASRYLAVPLVSIGWVPADADLGRSMRLGRPVVDAFPMALASVAFRRLANRFANADAMAPAFV